MLGSRQRGKPEELAEGKAEVPGREAGSLPDARGKAPLPHHSTAQRIHSMTIALALGIACAITLTALGLALRALAKAVAQDRRD